MAADNMTDKTNKKNNTANPGSSDTANIRKKPWLSPDYPTLDNYDSSEFAIDGTILSLYNGNGASVAIPNGVTYIASFVFSGRSDITSITIPDSVTRIGSYAFFKCSGLTSITIPDSIPYIGENMFSGCSSLTDIMISDSVESIGSRAFSGCSSLKSISVSSGNFKYHSRGNCIIETQSNTLILGCKNSVIPKNGIVTRIGDSAFSGCTDLKSITIPDCITSIGMFAFDGCSGLTGITIPDSVICVENWAFLGCSQLKVFCEAKKQPNGWDEEWNPDHRPVVWGKSAKRI